MCVSELDDEYIPEADWDHTKLEEHYQRIWEEPLEAQTTKELWYNRALRLFIVCAIATSVACLLFGVFIYAKMRRQLRYVNATNRHVRVIRAVFVQQGGDSLIPMSASTCDVTRLKQEIYALADADGKVAVEALAEASETWQRLLSLSLPVDEMIDWEHTGVVSAGDVVFFLALMQYFLSQSRRKGTPSVRRDDWATLAA